jgi:hypothetical protein
MALVRGLSRRAFPRSGFLNFVLGYACCYFGVHEVAEHQTLDERCDMSNMAISACEGSFGDICGAGMGCRKLTFRMSRI